MGLSNLLEFLPFVEPHQRFGESLINLVQVPHRLLVGIHHHLAQNADKHHDLLNLVSEAVVIPKQLLGVIIIFVALISP